MTHTMIPRGVAAADVDLDAPAAGFVTRLCASVIDTALISGALGGTAWLLDITARGLRRFAPPIDLVGILAWAAPFLAALYHIAFWAWAGQTPGKWVLGIRVHRIDGAPMTFGRALLRWLGYLVSALPLYLGFLWILGPRRRGFHDLLAGTEVLHVRVPAPPESAGTRLRRRWRLQAGEAGPGARPPALRE
jgi:uncharacterized RDD family membrane protein YckC